MLPFNSAEIVKFLTKLPLPMGNLISNRPIIADIPRRASNSASVTFSLVLCVLDTPNKKTTPMGFILPLMQKEKAP